MITKSIENEKVWQIAQRKYDDIIQQILFNRGLIGESESIIEERISEFINPSFENTLHNPSLMPDLDKVVKRLVKAKKEDQKVGIFADYDADGVPGAALLYRAMQKIGLKTEVYIPSRDTGYGLNQSGIDYLIEVGCQLIISIDLGIRNIDEALYCREKGIDLIITDHHLPGETIPDAFAVVNPKLHNSSYPFQELCGCGVVYKLIQGLAEHFTALSESFLKWNLDLVAISTISDMVPLIGENRTLVKYGLKVLKKTKNVGLQKLCQAAAIKTEMIDPYVVGFQIGPRINTPGRIDHASRSFELLTTDDEESATEWSLWLNEKNSERQKMMDAVFDQAVAQVESDDLAKNKIIVVSGKWDRGVLGPPASRLVEKYGRPAIVFAKEEEAYTGSARSINGVNIMELIGQAKDELVKFGGHKGAAGLTVSKKDYDKFVEKITKAANQIITPAQLTRKIMVDLEVDGDEISEKLYNQIEQLEPFGLGNPKPVFALRGVEIKQPRFVGMKQNHLSTLIKVGQKTFKTIYFNCRWELEKLLSVKKYDTLFQLGIDEWNGRKNISLSLIDLKENAKKE